MTIQQLVIGRRDRPHKKSCVKLDRRIERMIYTFEDRKINLEDYLSGLS